MLLTPAQIKPKSFESRQNSLHRENAPHVYVRARLLLWSYQYPNLSEGADRIGGQLHRDKECPFSGVTMSGRVWRKVLESDAQTLPFPMSSTPWVLYAYPMSLSTFPKFITLPFPLSLALPESCTCTPRLFQPFLSSLPYLFPCL